jgi:hypothetical protein
MDIEGQMAELEREREQLKAALAGEQDGEGPDAKGPGEPGDGDAGGPRASTPDLGPPPVDPEAT